VPGQGVDPSERTDPMGKGTGMKGNKRTHQPAASATPEQKFIHEYNTERRGWATLADAEPEISFQGGNLAEPPIGNPPQ
jgi:hypothetical protein